MKLNHAFSFVACLLFTITQAQQVNELHYKNISGKDNKTIDYADIMYGEGFVRIQTMPVNSRNPARYIEKKTNLLIMDFTVNRDYIVETLDSVYRPDSKLIATGDKKKIKGYNCEKFTMERTLVIGGVGIYGMQTYSSNYSYEIWITKDLTVDNSMGLYISHALLPLQVTFPYEGVIVQLDIEARGQKGSIVLDKAVTGAELTKDFTRPWLKEKPVPILPDGGGSAVTLRYSRESLKDQIKRMREQYNKVTGDDKWKAKYGFEGIVF
ncbi:MAG TPA: hypothetical protein VK154_06675 [Chitinophagales bacterium]|nr:hypothetical protein [Chitinophagales bacterium]